MPTEKQKFLKSLGLKEAGGWVSFNENNAVKWIGRTGRFFSGHWNRHHTSAVQHLLTDTSIQDVRSLVEKAMKIYPANPVGSLARRLAFIVGQLEEYKPVDPQPRVMAAP